MSWLDRKVERKADGFGGSAHSEAETTIIHVCAATAAGATGTMTTNPLWVVKTRFMVCLQVSLNMSQCNELLPFSRKRSFHLQQRDTDTPLTR